jgi:hypothetical protein
MRTIFGKLRLQREIDSIKFSYWALLSVSYLACVVDFIYKFDFVSTGIELVLITTFFRLFFRLIKELYYSYWTFAIIFAVYLFHGLWISITPMHSEILFYLYFIGVVFLGIQVYVLSSPIYFPQVSWWEYDFRFRDDVKITVKSKEESYEARLNDLRREAGCIVLFEDLNIGDVVKVYVDGSENIGVLNAEVMSKRLYSVGRPYNYGVKFIFYEIEEKDSYNRLMRYWKTERRSKLKLKYSKESS